MLLPGAVVEEASTSAEEAVLETAAAEAAEATSAAEAVTEWSPWSDPGGVKGRCGGRGWLCAAAAACWKCCRW